MLTWKCFYLKFFVFNSALQTAKNEPFKAMQRWGINHLSPKKIVPVLAH